MSEHPALVKSWRDGAVAVVELDRPKAFNALDIELSEAIRAAMRAIAQDAEVRAVLLCASGRSFGVGGDLVSMQCDDAAVVARRLIEPLHEAVRIMARLDAPVIAALHGPVAGGSLSLAFACDLAIAAEGTLLNLAYAKVGASCDVNGSWALPRIVGLRKALEIALLSDDVDLAEALRLGLVNRVVPAADLRREALAMAHRLADGPTLAHGRLKRLFRESFDRGLDAQLDAERDAFVASTSTDDFAEGIAAFLAKRESRFLGR